MTSQDVPIEQVVAQNADHLMSLDEAITGVLQGVSDESREPVVKVLVSHMKTGLLEKLPTRLGIYPVEVEVTGEFRAQRT